ncbi:tRNA (adenosine(37)-N6)-threonylcarbamoyltransferase complex dimerization subunit type 1 TsaB [Candidatus Dependentiae bacterium]|nr:tRNA (adenosine(37)-N6)-threonylcarbamoyltransferase complex dimerization subunit type 1 TsaB [Candidatus Dependentiae bacterium]
MTSHFLVLQCSYKNLSIGISCNEKLIDSVQEVSKTASSTLVPLAQSILKKNNLTLEALSGIIIDQGPGAFSSLRVLLSTVNALGFALKIPLVGLDGLDELAKATLSHILSENHSHRSFIIICLLNAYNAESYYGIYEINFDAKEIITKKSAGYKKTALLLDEIAKKYPNIKIYFSGNGIVLCTDQINSAFNSNQVELFPQIELAPLEILSKSGFLLFCSTQNQSSKLTPLYLKENMYTPSSKSS